MQRWAAMAAGLLLAGVGAAQHEGFGAAIYPEKLRADAERIRAAIHQAHPDPYRYITRGTLDAAFDSLSASLREPLAADRFMARLAAATNRIGDANLRLRLDPDAKDRIMRTAPLLPFEVRLLDEGLFIGEELKAFRSFPQGSRIIAINGMRSERVVQELGAWLPADGANATWRRHQVQEEFAWLFVLTYGPSPSYLIEYEAPDSTRHEERVAGMLQEDIERSRKPRGLEMHPWRSTWDAQTGTLWTAFTTLDPQALKRSGQKPQAFMEALAKELQQQRAQAWVIDLRGADGQELGMAELIFSFAAKKPFRLVQDMTVRATQLQALPGVRVPDGFIASIDRSYLPARNGVASLRPDDPRLALVAPDARAFTGRIYVVCDGGTREAAAALAMVAARTGRARLVGEEPGTNAHAFTGGRRIEVQAPNSLVRMELPLVRYIPDGETQAPEDRGEQPRMRAQQLPGDVARGRDGVRAALLTVIRELH